MKKLLKILRNQAVDSTDQTLINTLRKEAETERLKLEVENKTNPYKFSYQNNKFSMCIKNIGFAYRTNMDEYRVQIGENMRKKLKEDLSNYAFLN